MDLWISTALEVGVDFYGSVDFPGSGVIFWVFHGFAEFYGSGVDLKWISMDLVDFNGFGVDFHGSVDLSGISRIGGFPFFWNGFGVDVHGSGMDRVRCFLRTRVWL